jgi:hypothetical protein
MEGAKNGVRYKERNEERKAKNGRSEEWKE